MGMARLFFVKHYLQGASVSWLENIKGPGISINQGNLMGGEYGIPNLAV
jgi:hypothetical protein